MRPYKHYLIVDLEATCCDQKSIPRNQMETIEIGAVMVDGDTLTILSEFNTFIKPVRHPVLTSFCSTLTSIQQHDVDNAPSYAEAVAHFKRWLYQYDDFVFCSWGDYDKSQLEQDSQFHNIGFPIGAEHWNIKKAFSNTQHLSRTYGMAGALKMAGLELTGTHHRGIDDVRNMVKLMPYILGRQQLNP